MPATPMPWTSSLVEVRETIVAAQRGGVLVGLIPTMGALHEGHLSLVDAARQECGFVVASIFVNPTQFGAHEDLGTYPRTLQADLDKLNRRGCDLAFVPRVEAMYAPDHGVSVDVGNVAAPLEGVIRPGHFQGVATVVLKLLNIAPADRAYFGQKDYQQTLVVQRLASDLNLPVKICVCPIVREADGLAMSSRNAYLSPDERRRAAGIYRALAFAQGRFDEGERNVAALRTAIERVLSEVGGIEVDYIAFVVAGSVVPVMEVAGPTVVAVAVRIGSTRLLDNWQLG